MTKFESQWSQEKIERFNQEFLNWYYQKGRSYLPWRLDRHPYGTWVSEIMLQQTRVDTVIPYFQRFLENFPTIKALSDAPEEAVLKNWEGLGYYSRARNLQLGAQQVMREFNGQLPETKEELLKIKGIGPYTAGAIASMAFNEKVAAVDGNTLRVFARLFAIEEDIAKMSTVKAFAPLIEEVMSPVEPGNFNQALMDLGSSICTPKNPQCENCPLKNYCLAFEKGIQESLPVKAKKPKPKPVYYLALAIENNEGEYLVEKRDEKLLSGFWHFPLVEVSKEVYEAVATPTENLGMLVAEDDFAKTEQKLQGLFPNLLHNQQIVLQKRDLGTIQHVFSHLKWHVRLFYSRQVKPLLLEDSQQFVSLNETNLPLPKAQFKLMNLLPKEE